MIVTMMSSQYIIRHLSQKSSLLCAVPSGLMATVSNLKLADRANKKFLSMVLWGWPDVIGPLVSFILDPAAACDSISERGDGSVGPGGRLDQGAGAGESQLRRR